MQKCLSSKTNCCKFNIFFTAAAQKRAVTNYGRSIANVATHFGNSAPAEGSVQQRLKSQTNLERLGRLTGINPCHCR